jgi:transposase-like protein
MVFGTGKKPQDRVKLLENIMRKAEVIAEFVKKGMSVNSACRAAGVNPRTYYDWQEKAEKGMVEYQPVVDFLEQARAAGQAELLQKVIDASNEDWKAAAWILERRHPDFRKQSELTLNGGENPIQVEGVQNWTKAAEERLKQLLAKRQEIEALQDPAADVKL